MRVNQRNRIQRARFEARWEPGAVAVCLIAATLRYIGVLRLGLIAPAYPNLVRALSLSTIYVPIVMHVGRVTLQVNVQRSSTKNFIFHSVVYLVDSGWSVRTEMETYYSQNTIGNHIPVQRRSYNNIHNNTFASQWSASHMICYLPLVEESGGPLIRSHRALPVDGIVVV